MEDENYMKRILRLIFILLLTLYPMSGLAVSSQRNNIERFPFYDSSAETSPNNCSPTGDTTGSSSGGGSLYFLGDSIGEGLKSASLEIQLSAIGYNVKMNVDRSRSITGKGANTKTSGLEAVATDIDTIKTGSTVIIELGTNPENNFERNLTTLVETIKSANPNTKIYFIDVAADAQAAKRLNIGATNAAIYKQAEIAGTVVMSRFKLYYPSGNPQNTANLPAPALPFDSLGVHSTTSKDYQAMNEVIISTLNQAASNGSPTDDNICICGTSATGNTTTTSNIPGSDNQQKAFNYFIGKGLSPQQSAGIVGNLIAESGVNPKRVQSTETPQGDKDNITVNDNTGYGIAQWTSRGRQQGLVDLARRRGLNIEGDLSLQLDYVFLELSRGLINQLKAAPDLLSASNIILLKYERPADQSASVQAKRAALGQQVLNRYGDKSASIPGSTTSTVSSSSPNCSGTSTNTAAGFVGFPLATTKARMNTLNGTQFKNGVMGQGGHPYAAHDIMADPGTPVLAILQGKVVGVSTDKCPGRLIAIYDASQGVTVAYLHLSIAQTLVKVGDTIKAGQLIGYVGQASEGCGTPHLHIDANTSDRRIGCKRESCSAENQALFRAGSDKIGLAKGLFDSYQKLP